MKSFWTLALGLILLLGFAAWQLWPAGLRADDAALAELAIDKMTCSSCVQTIDSALREQSGVGAVEISVTAGRGRVEYDPRRTTAAAVADCVTGAGYPARVTQDLTVADYRALREERDELAKTYVARIGERLLARSEFEKVLARRAGGKETTPRQRAAVWDELLQRELLLNAAEQAGVVVQDGEVEARLAELASSHADFDQQAAKRFGSQGVLFTRVKNDLIINRLLERQAAAADVSPSSRPAAINRWYEKLARNTEVVIFDPVLRAAAALTGGSGCGGSCCG
jgi:copper chaperone CopZ